MSDVVLSEVRDSVALITFNRPERNNSMTEEMKTRYFDRLEEHGKNPDVRAIVLTGAGKSFCVGADTQNLQAIDPTKDDNILKEQRPVTYPLSTRKPIIGAINGACAGVGLVHALCCDVRFAAAGAKMTTAFVRRGLIAEYGVSWILPRLIGTARAFDLIVSGRVIKTEEAKELGVVNQIHPREDLVEAAMAYARDIAQNCAPLSMAIMKEQIYADLTRDLDAAYENAGVEMRASLKRPDLKEGVASFLEKRPPNFPGFS